VPVLAGRCMISDGLLLWGVLALWHSTASVQVDLADLEEIWEGLLRLTVLVGFMGKKRREEEKRRDESDHLVSMLHT
jgi:hypothetical protein